MSREIYLDNSATTRPYDEVIDFVNHISREVYGNPSSLHTKGIEAERMVRNAREIVAKSLGVSRDEIYFTSGGTEANNLAIAGYLFANPRKGKHIITTKIEHPSVLEVFNNLSQHGYKVDFIDVDKNGIVIVDDLRKKINEETSLISVIYINNETGAVQPIDKIVEVKNSINKDIVLHVDAVQAYGKIRIAPEKQGIDLLTMSSHKIHGPKGVGALYTRRDIKLKPIIFGGGQESQLRSGTENVPGICGFGAAVDITFRKMEESSKYCEKLKSMLLDMLKKEVEDVVIVSPEGSSPYILNAAFPNVRAEVLLHHLETKNIFVSTGAACSSRKQVLSHVLRAMGIKPEIIEGAIRFSFSSFNNEEDIIKTVEAIKDILPKIRIKRGGRR
ncbi:MAG TPA: cysteine desulfurase [Hungateiclostridium thermocellum]|uniref:cysteine desulfurase n=2 Tax=Acetivibrio thermocellus TaxID=1515 RepID=A3DEB7_ACET2|nr:cysteine desulfurase family protein [Acetivibrio thermocellus]CDG35759.1 putative cysteine desulfurase [Acetivibrio thermocellus BC1]ABN52296.1 Cysteine desulfurase [Acetivibrio thermocellus ATCC 27405]ADU74214.1 Cysteine desulfurase [Acetivibrio thermocellus DSM 1313]ALX08157.1 Cysteine desulfurase [Acetivibrio thermocellus AD2]ANV75904.1 Cysteine desulfurase [Acetivibrio thermocellus DSM 2360]